MAANCTEVNAWQGGCSSVAGAAVCDPSNGEQRFVAVAAQQLFILTAFSYAPGTNSLIVHRNGLLIDPLNITELSATTFWIQGEVLVAGDVIVANALTGVTADVSVLVTNLFTSKITLIDGQQAVPFPATVPVTNSAIYINGPGVDSGRLVEDTNYTADIANNIINLIDSYPAGSILSLVYNDAGATNTSLLELPSNTVWHEFSSEIGTKQHLLLSVGGSIKTNYFDLLYTSDSGGEFEHTGVTTIAKAGNTPDADGFFYDLDGKQFKITGVANVKVFGAIGDGIVNDTVAIQAAITASFGDVYTPTGIYMCAGLSTSDDSKITFIGEGPSSIFKKNANGEVITLGKQCTIKSMAIDGNGANFTGIGVLINTGLLDNFSWRRFTEVDIYETASYCIEFTGNRAGYASQIENCRLVPRTTSIVAAIKMAGNAGVTESNGNRMLRNVWSFSQPLADLTDATNTDIVGCHGFLPIFSATTTKTNISGGRLNILATDFTLTGTANTMSGLTINSNGGNIVLDAGCINCRWDSSNVVGSGITVTDNSDGANSGNEMWLPSIVFTPIWAGNAPAIGDGALNGQYIRKGLTVKVNIQLTAGATTTFGAGAWSFSLPYTPASRNWVGSAYVEDSSGIAIYVGTAYITSGLTTVRVVTNGSTTAYVGSASPMVWANGDKLFIDIEYQIA